MSEMSKGWQTQGEKLFYALLCLHLRPCLQGGRVTLVLLFTLLEFYPTYLFLFVYNSPIWVNFLPSCMTSNCANLNGIIQFLSLIINIWKIKSHVLSTMIILSLFCEFNLFPIENFKIISNFGLLRRMSRMTKHVSKACKVDSGDRVTLRVKFACKPELTLTRLLG